MADKWGIDPSYVDAMGVEHTVSDATVDRLREIIGQSAPLYGPSSWVPDNQCNSAPDSSRSKTARHHSRGTQRDLPLGYHLFEGHDCEVATDHRVAP